MIARKHEPPGAGIPNRAGERPSQSREAVRSPFFVDVRNQLAVGRALKFVPKAVKLPANVGCVRESGVGDRADCAASVHTDREIDVGGCAGRATGTELDVR